VRGWLILALAACERSAAKPPAPADAAPSVERAPNLPPIDTTGCPTTCAPLAQRVPDFAKLKQGCSNAIGDAMVLSYRDVDMTCGQHMLYAGCCDAVVVEANGAAAMARLGWKNASHTQRVGLAYVYARDIDQAYPIEATDPLAAAIGASYTPPTDTRFGDGVQLDFWGPIEPDSQEPTDQRAVQHVRYRFDASGAVQADTLERKDVARPPVDVDHYVMRRDAAP
jgi:hypothetical protein